MQGFLVPKMLAAAVHAAEPESGMHPAMQNMLLRYMGEGKLRCMTTNGHMGCILDCIIPPIDRWIEKLEEPPAGKEVLVPMADFVAMCEAFRTRRSKVPGITATHFCIKLMDDGTCVLVGRYGHAHASLSFSLPADLATFPALERCILHTKPVAIVGLDPTLLIAASKLLIESGCQCRSVRVDVYKTNEAVQFVGSTGEGDVKTSVIVMPLRLDDAAYEWKERAT